MSATRNPYYQLPGGADLPGDVRVSDIADASKTAADGWAASPAAVASAAATLSSLVCRFDIGDNSVHFKFTPTFGIRASFVLISITQSSGICCNSLVVHNNDGTSASTELVSNGISVKKSLQACLETSLMSPLVTPTTAFGVICLSFRRITSQISANNYKQQKSITKRKEKN